MAVSRILNFWIFPVTVMGKSSAAATNFQYFGTLKWAIFPLQKAFMSSSVSASPSFGKTHAMSSSPYFTSGTPTT